MIIPTLGCRIPITGDSKTTMGINKTEMSEENKVVSFEKANKLHTQEPPFSKGMYDWVMFVLNYYSRVKETLKIDFESFVILQVVVSHSLYSLNKEGSKNYHELENDIVSFGQNNKRKNDKLNIASISDILQLPRETVRRKALKLEKKSILDLEGSNGIKLGSAYKTIYKEFVSQSTLDLSKLLKKWNKSGALNKFLEVK